MRIALAAPLLLLAACDVEQNEGNGTTTVSFDQEAAENTLEDVGEHAENVGSAIATDVEQTGDQIQNEVGDVDVDIDTGDGNAN